MIAFITGTLLSKSPQSARVEVQGIGYEIFIPLGTFYNLPDPGETISLHTHLHVREDILALYGFESSREKTLFLLLMGVSGVGPKLALNILSGMPPEDLIRAVGSGNAAKLSSIPGVGKKTADRLALELKDKMTAVMAGGVPDARPAEASVGDDIVSALVNLGYKKPQAKEAVDKILADTNGDLPIEAVIKAALKILSR